MYVVLLALIVAGAVLALVSAVGALRAYLRLRRARAALQDHLTEEVEGLARRTGELERGIAALERRSAQLPVTISDLQRNLSSLRVLTAALSASLRQAQRVLSYSATKTLSDIHPRNLLQKNGRAG